ncbi:MAG TPA: hypothetical protein DCY13_21955, partial [Verrucomicrobiales bacterium]|nr:hypothetical protein [Verrucomicrobiales bacterium]
MDHQSLTADHPVRQVFRFIESQGESPEALSADGLDERFNELALALFEFQFAQNPPLRRWCENRGAHPQKIDHWTQIPAMPTTAFREMELSCIQPDQRSVSFHSSGTTGHQPSRHFHSAASLQLYDASLKPWFRRHLLPNWQPSVADEGGKLRMRPQILSLTPPPAAAPNSSLVHMFEVVRQEFGDAHSVFAGSVDVDGGWSFAPEEVAGWLQRHTVLNHPVIFCGTAFNFVQLIDWMISRDECINLPPGS